MHFSSEGQAVPNFYWEQEKSESGPERLQSRWIQQKKVLPLKKSPQTWCDEQRENSRIVVETVFCYHCNTSNDCWWVDQVCFLVCVQLLLMFVHSKIWEKMKFIIVKLTKHCHIKSSKGWMVKGKISGQNSHCICLNILVV